MKRALLLASLAACAVPPLDATGKVCTAAETCPGGLTCVRAVGADTGRCGTAVSCDVTVPRCDGTQQPCDRLLVDAPAEDFHWRFVADGYSAVWARGARIVYRRWNLQLEPETPEVTLSERGQWPWLVPVGQGVIVSWLEGRDVVWARLSLAGAAAAGPVAVSLDAGTRLSPRVAWNGELGISAVVWLDETARRLRGVTVRLDGGIETPTRGVPPGGRDVDAFDLAENFTNPGYDAGWVNVNSGHDSTGKLLVEFFLTDGAFNRQVDSWNAYFAHAPSLAYASQQNRHWFIWAEGPRLSGRSSEVSAPSYDVATLDAGAEVAATATFIGPFVAGLAPLIFSVVQEDGAAHVYRGLAGVPGDKDPSPISTPLVFASLPTQPPEVAMGQQWWAIAYPADAGYGPVVRTQVHCAF